MIRKLRALKGKYIIAIFIIIIPVMFMNQTFSNAVNNDRDVNKNKIKDSPQYKDGSFHNAVEWNDNSFWNFLGIAWDFLFAGNNRTPDTRIPRQMADLSGFNSSVNDHLSVTWLGHSSLLINIDGIKILTDPVYEKKVSFFGPSRYNGDTPLKAEDLPEIDLVIISHNHYDHLNKYSVELLSKKAKRFIVPLAVGRELMDCGIPAEKITEMDWWDEFKIGDSLMIASTPAQHFSGRGLTDRNKSLWASFVIKTRNHKVFFGGDGGYFDGFKKIGEKYGPFDMTFLECGAYNEKWHPIHMYPEETVKAHIDLKGNILHPIHWGTFNLSLHSWYEPMQRLSAAAAKAGIKTATPIVGGTTEFGKIIPSEKWWEKYLPIKGK
ncbi:MAG: MBL fold metallo-hydrolase [Bacteroidota bacterium]|jgi:L-ascorbate metabolism protein UlaG (beta-lactamase superfamily)